MNDHSSTMKQCVILMMAVLCVRGAPVEPLTPGSCQDAAANGAAGEALNKINLDRTEGYVFSMDRLSNVHYMKHGETGVVFYLTFDVLETNCHVLSKKNWRNCETRGPEQYPLYGQCKAVMYMNKVQRVSRLYKYSCVVRPVPASKVREHCPDCPAQLSKDHEDIVKTVKMAIEKYNKESGLANYFVPLNVSRASAQYGFGRFHHVEFTIQETVCSNKTDIADISKCELMACEFAHKGFCKASHSVMSGEENLSAECEIFEPEASVEEKKKHLIGGEVDHSHSNTGSSAGHGHSHGHGHGHTHDHTHDHAHDHTHDHDHTKPHKHTDGSGHHHDHGKGHGHAHSHDHSHDHVHAHHEKAHEHGQDEWEHQHHQYGHKKDETHEHDHEMVLDHEHKHRHLHNHEHYHHHHDHVNKTATRKPEGTIDILPPIDKPMVLPSFPDKPVAGPETPSTLPFHPDPQIPGQREPTIHPFPSEKSPNCPAQSKIQNVILIQLFSEDPLFKPAE